MEQYTHAVIRRVLQFVIPHIAEDLNLSLIALATGYSKFSLCRVFKNNLGVSPMLWLWKLRADLARFYLIETPKVSITEIAFKCGFKSSTHFGRVFKNIYGKTPKEYRRDYNKNKDQGRVYESLFKQFDHQSFTYNHIIC